MNTDTGEIRRIQTGEDLAPKEIELTPEEAKEAMFLPPHQRLAWWANSERGKNRSLANRGHAAKVKARNRKRR